MLSHSRSRKYGPIPGIEPYGKATRSPRESLERGAAPRGQAGQKSPVCPPKTGRFTGCLPRSEAQNRLQELGNRTRGTNAIASRGPFSASKQSKLQGYRLFWKLATSCLWCSLLPNSASWARTWFTTATSGSIKERGTCEGRPHRDFCRPQHNFRIACPLRLGFSFEQLCTC